MENKTQIECGLCGNICDGATVQYNDDKIACESCIEAKCFCCDKCCEAYTTDNMKNDDGNSYCQSCWNENKQNCHNCGVVFFDKENYSYGNWNFCSEDCMNEETFCCDDCGDRFRSDRMCSNDNGVYCDNCYSDENNLFNDPLFKFYTTPVTSKLNTKGFTVGIELETLNQNGVDELPGNLRKMVCAKEDGSLPSNGVEFTTLPTSNDNTYDTVKELCQFLVSNNFDTDRSCGYHLHIGEQSRVKFTPENIHKIVVTYTVFKDCLKLLIARSRWGNHYASFGRHDINYHMFKKNTRDNPENNYRDRYSFINLCSLGVHNTIEIRCHQGTINFEKIMNWIKINLNMFEFAINSTYDDLLTLRGTVPEFERLILKDKVLIDYLAERIKDFGYKPVLKSMNVRQKLRNDISLSLRHNGERIKEVKFIGGKSGRVCEVVIGSDIDLDELPAFIRPYFYVKTGVKKLRVKAEFHRASIDHLIVPIKHKSISATVYLDKRNNQWYFN